MASSNYICEIVESKEEPDLVCSFDGSNVLSFKLKADERVGTSHGYTVEDDLSRFMKAIDLRASPSAAGPSRQMDSDIVRKSALKRPVKAGMSQPSGIGITESVTLKQALRKLCISQASEMAAVKRLSKPIGVPGVSEAETIKRLYASAVVQPDVSGLSLEEGRENLFEISAVPEKTIIDSSAEVESCQAGNLESSSKTVVSTPHSLVSVKDGVLKTSIKDVIRTESTDDGDNSSTVVETGSKGRSTLKTALSSSQIAAVSGKTGVSPRLIKPVFRSKTSIKKKEKRDPTAAPVSSSKCGEANRVLPVPIKTKVGFQKRSVSPASKSTNPNSEGVKKNKDSGGAKPDSTPNGFDGSRAITVNTSDSSRSREKGECSQSSKSSIGDYSTSTSISDESHHSGSSGHGSRPHMSKDVRWIAIRHVVLQQGSLGLKNFKLLKRLGCGDIGTVYLAELTDSGCLFALKVMDIDYLVSRKKMLRAQTERDILLMLDHPFLPTLYAHFTTDNLSCLVMEYCPGGDLHVLRQKQPSRSFSEAAARFYVAEVLLALEYLHMLGVVYRDLKPENILVREDGHIMLSDFDLSLRCTVSPTLVRSSSLGQERAKKLSGPCAENSCIEPFCLQPSWVNVSCFTPRLASSTMAKTRKQKSDISGQVSPFPQLVVEPTDARSNSFVGTHEYLAPEIIRGDGHGSAVDWWTFGIFLYELIYGRTPFKGPGNEETLANVVNQSLKFPENPAVSFNTRDLIRGLLIKEPENRLGSVRGAAEIKQHPFFEGLNWALIRCAAPPETPRSYDVATPMVVRKKKEGKCLDFRPNGERVEFEIF